MNLTLAEVEAERARRLAEVDAELARRKLRALAADDVAAWAEYAPPTLVGPMLLRRWQRHALSQVQAMEALLRQPDGRVHVWLVSAPSQEGKSELMRRSVCWLAARGWSGAVVTYAGEVAEEHSRATRDYLRSDRGLEVWPHVATMRDVKPTARQVAEGDSGRSRMHAYTVPARGNRRSAHVLALGRRGSITGRTTDWLWLDDMYQSAADYLSGASRREVDTVLRTAVAPRLLTRGGHLLCWATRWGEYDVHAMLRAMIAEAEARGGEVVLHDVEYPVRARADSPDGRAPGEAISPGWNQPGREATARAFYGRYASAILDCTPSPDGGAAWPLEYLSHRYDVEPRAMAAMCERSALVVDAASTYGGGDHSVIQWWGWIGPRAYLLGQWRGQWDYVALRERVKDLHASCRTGPERRVAPAVVVENASAGRQIVQELQRALPGVEAVTPVGSKLARWQAAQPMCAAGQVLLPEARHMPEVADIIDRLLRLTGTGDEVDDEADTMAHALTWGASGALRVASWGRRR